MKHKESLFQLIKSLSKNEKGYFKKFVSRYTSVEKSNYIRLFEIIDKQEEYDEKKIKKQFITNKLSKNLSVSKNYLYSAILKSLRSYSNDNSIDAVIHDILNDVDVLFKKALYRDCEILLDKAKVLAVKHEKQLLLLEIYNYQLKFEWMEYKTKGVSEEMIGDKYQEQVRLLDVYKNSLDYKLLLSKLIITDATLVGKSEEHTVRLHELVNSPLTQEDLSPLSYRAGITYYNLLGRLHAFYLNDLDKAYIIYQKFIAFAESNQLLLQQDIMAYFAVLNNLMLIQQDLRKFEEFELTLQKLKDVECLYPDWEIKKFERCLMLELAYYIKSAQIKEGITCVEKSEKKIKQYRELLNKNFLLAIYDSISLLYFYNENYSRALYYVNEILNSNIKLRTDLKCFSNILYLIIHYELGNIDHIEYVYTKIEKFIKETKGTEGFEWAVLKFMQKLPFVTEENKLKKEFSALRQETGKYKTRAQDKSVFDFFDVSLWAQSKEEGIKLIELLRQAKYGDE